MLKLNKELKLNDEQIGTLRFALHLATNTVKDEFQKGKNSEENYLKLKELSEQIYNYIINKNN